MTVEVLDLQWMRLILFLEKEWLMNSFTTLFTNCIYLRTIFSVKKEKGHLTFMS